MIKENDIVVIKPSDELSLMRLNDLAGREAHITVSTGHKSTMP